MIINRTDSQDEQQDMLPPGGGAFQSMVDLTTQMINAAQSGNLGGIENFYRLAPNVGAGGPGQYGPR